MFVPIHIKYVFVSGTLPDIGHKSEKVDHQEENLWVFKVGNRQSFSSKVKPIVLTNRVIWPLITERLL